MIAQVFDDIERDPQPFVDCNHRTAMLLDDSWPTSSGST